MTNKLSVGVSQSITYVDSKGVTTHRTIIPVTIPADNIRALDVTGLSDEEINHLSDKLAEYKQYKSAIMQHMWTLEEFIKSTDDDGTLDTISWRSFNRNRVSIPD